MDKKLNLPERKRNWKITLALLLACAVLLATVFGGRVGCESSDLLPTGAVLTYTATVALVLAFVHRWRRARKFLILAAASVAGFFLFAVLENLSYALGQMAADASFGRHLGEFFHGFFFCIALLVCPAGVFVGVVGSLIMAAANFRKRRLVGH
jgi:hypothetical protein